jgi:hypothetical protein
MLRDGNWKGRQIVPRDWVKETTRPFTRVTEMNPISHRVEPFGYGYMWWVWDGPAATGPYQGAYTAQGSIGQWITVLPVLNLVIVHKTAPESGRQVLLSEYLGVVNTILQARCHARPEGIEAWCADQAAQASRIAARRREAEARVTLTASEQAVYVGTYTFNFATLGRTVVLHVADEDGALVRWVNPANKRELIPLGNHVFGSSADPQFRLTFIVEGGRAVRARLQESGMPEPVEGPRTP